MSKMLSIAKYEYRMQVKRIAGWIVLLFGKRQKKRRIEEGKGIWENTTIARSRRR